jgi:hypothetical protein
MHWLVHLMLGVNVMRQPMQPAPPRSVRTAMGHYPRMWLQLMHSAAAAQLVGLMDDLSAGAGADAVCAS